MLSLTITAPSTPGKFRKNSTIPQFLPGNFEKIPDLFGKIQGILKEDRNSRKPCFFWETSVAFYWTKVSTCFTSQLVCPSRVFFPAGSDHLWKQNGVFFWNTKKNISKLNFLSKPFRPNKFMCHRRCRVSFVCCEFQPLERPLAPHRFSFCGEWDGTLFPLGKKTQKNTLQTFGWLLFSIFLWELKMRCGTPNKWLESLKSFMWRIIVTHSRCYQVNIYYHSFLNRSQAFFKAYTKPDACWCLMAIRNFSKPTESTSFFRMEPMQSQIFFFPTHSALGLHRKLSPKKCDLFHQIRVSNSWNIQL